MAASWAISPPTYIPISRTTASCSGPIRSTVSGSPISLLALPSLLRVVKRSDRTAATASLVEVLAMLPVTPTTSGENRPRQALATAWSPSSVSGTATIATSASSATSHVYACASGPVGLTHQQGGRAGRDGVAKETMAVGRLAGQGDEEVPGRDRA